MESDSVTVIAPVFERADARGTFIEAVNAGHWESLAYGTMGAGHVMGQHYHRETVVFFFVTRGQADITIENIETKRQQFVTLHAREGTLLRVNHAHHIKFAVETDYLLMKSQAYSNENPDTYHYDVTPAS